MKTKLFELRKIRNGQLFRFPLTNALYIRGEYLPRFFSFKCYRFDDVDVELVLSSETLVTSASIVEI